MEKRDLAILILALGVVLAAALVLKPMLTGKGPDLSLPFMADERTPVQEGATDPGITPYPTPSPTIPTPSPTPTWGGQCQTLGFVSAGTPRDSPAFTRLPEIPPDEGKMLTYAIIESVGTGTTQSISMPFPYWELHYTVDPWETTFVGETSSKEAGQASFFATEVFPSFSIEVRDGSDGSLIREVEPRGGLNAEHWGKGEDYDPRPWIEKFYEEKIPRKVYFIIHTHMIHSYRVEVMVPDHYLGKY